MSIIGVQGPKLYMSSEAPIGGGGGYNPSGILKPNLQSIIRLRGFPGDFSERPKEIKGIALIDDDPSMGKALCRVVSSIARPICGRELQLVSSFDLTAGARLDGDKFPIVFASASNETEAIAGQILATGVNFVISDFNLIGITGGEITADLHASGYKGFVVGLTGLANKNMKTFYAAGADLVMEKPFDRDIIASLFA
ncbi:MAG TPA: hypothetical protein VMD02_02620 [Candidatus Omnitrophota bacterium]|nr:hypothetical protein [Candidatus Omnitrophota bacterium]